MTKKANQTPAETIIKAKPAASTKSKPKRKPLPPIPCLASIGKPVSDNPLCFQFEAIGYFPSYKKARAKVDAIRAENPLYTFVILPNTQKGKEPLYDNLAATLPHDEAMQNHTSENP